MNEAERTLLAQDTEGKRQKHFWSRIKVGTPDECWPWTGSRHGKGYGQLMFGTNRTTIKTHRLAYLFTHGTIPAGHQVLHRCDNPPCCNPAHLFTGTNDDNVEDKMQKGRFRCALGEKQHLAKLNPVKVRLIRLMSETTSQRKIARHFGVTKNAISMIQRGITWRHVL